MGRFIVQFATFYSKSRSIDAIYEKTHPEDFPGSGELVPVRTITFKGADLKRMLGQISYAITLNDSRKVLHGMLFSYRDGVVTMVATDSKRLAMTERAVENVAGGNGDCIIPLQAANEIKRQADPQDDVTLEIGDKMARFTTSDTVLTTKLIEGNYPNFRQVIPSTFTRIVPDVSTFLSRSKGRKSPLMNTPSSYVR